MATGKQLAIAIVLAMLGGGFCVFILAILGVLSLLGIAESFTTYVEDKTLQDRLAVFVIKHKQRQMKLKASRKDEIEKGHARDAVVKVKRSEIVIKQSTYLVRGIIYLYNKKWYLADGTLRPDAPVEHDYFIWIQWECILSGNDSINVISTTVRDDAPGLLFRLSRIWKNAPFGLA